MAAAAVDDQDITELTTWKLSPWRSFIRFRAPLDAADEASTPGGRVLMTNMFAKDVAGKPVDPDEPGEVFSKALDEARNRKAYASSAGLSRALRTCKSASRLMIEDFRRREAGSKGLIDEPEDDAQDEDDDKDVDGASGHDSDANDADDSTVGGFEVVPRSAALSKSFTTSRMEAPASRQGQRCGIPVSGRSWRQLAGGPSGSRAGGGVCSIGGGGAIGLFDDRVVGTAGQLDGSGILAASGGSFSSKELSGAASGGALSTPSRPMSAVRQRPPGTPLSPTPRAALETVPRDSGSAGSGSAASSCSGGGVGAGTRNPAIMLKMIEAAAVSQAARRRAAAAISSGPAAGPRELQRSCPNLYIPQALFEEVLESAPASGGAAAAHSGGATSTPTSPGGIVSPGVPAAAAAAPNGSLQRAMAPGRAPSRLGISVAAIAEDAGGGALNEGRCNGGGGDCTSFVIPQQQQQQQPLPQHHSLSSSANAMVGNSGALTSASGDATTFLTDGGDDGAAAALSPVRRLRSITAAASSGAGLSSLMGGLGSGGGGGGGGVSSTGGSGDSRPVTPGTGALINFEGSWRTRQLSPGGRLLHAQATLPSSSRRSIDLPHTAGVGPLSPGLGGRITRGSASLDLGSRPLTPGGLPGGPATSSLTTCGGGAAATDSVFNSRITPAAVTAEAGAAGGIEAAVWRGGAVTSLNIGASTMQGTAPLLGRSSSPAVPFAGSSGTARAGLLQPLAAVTACSCVMDTISEVLLDSAGADAAASQARVQQPAVPSTPSPAGGRMVPAMVPHPPTAPPPQTLPGGAASLTGSSRRSLQARAALLVSSASGTITQRSEGSALQSAADVASGAPDADITGGGKPGGSSEQGPGTPCPNAGAHPSIMERVRGLFV